MLCILGKVVPTSYLLQQSGTAEWKSECSYFSCLFKPNPVILLPAKLLSFPPPLLDPFCMKERVFWLLLPGVHLPWCMWCDLLGGL